MAVWWKNHIKYGIRQILKIRIFLQLLQKFQVPIKANHWEADICWLIGKWSEDPPAENIIQLYSMRWHIDFGRLKKRRFTSYWLHNAKGKWNILANRTHEMSSGSDSRLAVFYKQQMISTSSVILHSESIGHLSAWVSILF